MTPAVEWLRGPASNADDSLPRHPTVFVSGGRRSLEIELAPDALLQALGAELMPLGR